MEGRLVDTNVVSYLMKKDSRGDLYQPHLNGKVLYISFVTVAELYQWAISHNWGSPRVTDLRARIGFYNVLQPDDLTAWKWAELSSIRGHPISAGDAWIAATALRHGLSLVTHNRKHFDHIGGLNVISEA